MESPFPSRAELDPPEQTPHVCLLACSPHPDGSTDAAARLLTRLYALAEGKPCLLRFGKMESGSARNAVSDHTHLEGSLRCLDDGLYAAAGPSARRRAAP